LKSCGVDRITYEAKEEITDGVNKEELISSLRREVRILVHLAGKVDKSKIDYRPTSKQRSTLELLCSTGHHGPHPACRNQEWSLQQSRLERRWGPRMSRRSDEL